MADITGTQRERVDKVRNKKDKLAGYLYDLSKLIFAGTIVANIPMVTSNNMDSVYVLSIGIFGTIVFAWIANRILTY